MLEVSHKYQVINTRLRVCEDELRKELPRGYKEDAPWEIGTGDFLKKNGILWPHKPKIFRLSQIDILNKSITLDPPVEICFKREEGVVFAANDFFLIYEFGDTETEVIEKFKSELIFCVNHYRTLPKNKVCGQAEKIKQYVDNLSI